MNSKGEKILLQKKILLCKILIAEILMSSLQYLIAYTSIMYFHSRNKLMLSQIEQWCPIGFSR